MLNNALTFLLAGFETTSITLSYAAYRLAKHPAVQEKLREEIDEHWQGQKEVDYDVVNEMKYLDIFIREVLRMRSNTNRLISRECSQSTIVAGHKIEKGKMGLYFLLEWNLTFLLFT